MDLSKYYVEKLQTFLSATLTGIIVLLAGFCYIQYKTLHETPETLKEFKDGVQNHLVWDVKGQCFFVRPHSDVTTYLIRITDCDKK